MNDSTLVPIDVTSTEPAEPLRNTIRRQGEVIRHPDGYPERLVFRALAYVYAAYALGSRTATEELDAHLRRYQGRGRPSPAVAMGMARGFLRLAEERA
jgi:hypothetical protein